MRPGKDPSRSPGGYLVDDTLESLGYLPRPGVTLVETGAARRRSYDAVVCQNAWNFIPLREFIRLLRDYPTRSRLRYAARRVLAYVNVSRAGRVVVLTDYMRRLLEPKRCDLVSTFRCYLPLDVFDAPTQRLPGVPEGEPFWLVPGTLTWYKNASYVVDMVALMEPDDRPLLVLAGTDDHSGCADSLRGRLEDLGLRHIVTAVDRSQMYWLLSNADATVIPSKLESLSLSLGEALVLSRRVFASRLDVHVEVATALGRTPHWLSGVPGRDLEALASRGANRGRVTSGSLDQPWIALAKSLGS